MYIQHNDFKRRRRQANFWVGAGTFLASTAILYGLMCLTFVIIIAIVVIKIISGMV